MNKDTLEAEREEFNEGGAERGKEEKGEGGKAEELETRPVWLRDWSDEEYEREGRSCSFSSCPGVLLTFFIIILCVDNKSVEGEGLLLPVWLVIAGILPLCLPPILGDVLRSNLSETA